MEAVMAYQSLIIVLVIAVLVIVILTTGYIKAPPDTAYIISGLRKKIIIGKASIKIPFFERMDRLSLKLIPIDVKTSTAVPTADYINIQVDAAVNIKISSDSERLSVAAENFLNQDTDYIARVAREVLEGNMREIVGRMKLEEMVSDRQKFAELVKENAMPDLAAMGLDIDVYKRQLLDTLTAYENIALPLTIQRVNPKKIDSRIKKLSVQLGIEEVLKKYPYQMSGGQQQRVACARAMICHPSLILADEPTGALDSKASRMLLNSFEVLNKSLEATILMVTPVSYTHLDVDQRHAGRGILPQENLFRSDVQLA